MQQANGVTYGLQQHLVRFARLIEKLIKARQYFQSVGSIRG